MNVYDRAKDPAEVIYPYVDFARFLSIGTGSTILDDENETKVEVFDGDDLVPDMNPAPRVIEGSKIFQVIGNGEVGKTYEIRWTAKRTDGLIHVQSFGLKVRAAKDR